MTPDNAVAQKSGNIGLLTAIGVLFGMVSIISPGTVFDVVLTCVVILSIGLFSRSAERSFLVKLFIWGLLLRVILLLIIQPVLIYINRWFTAEGVSESAAYLFGDDGYYTLRSWGIVQHMLGYKIDSFMVPRTLGYHGYTFYLYIVAFFYYLFGFSPISVTFTNCIFSVSTGVVYYFVAKEISNDKSARVAAIIITFFPSLMIWSISNLKDALFIFLTGIIFLAFMKVIRTDKIGYWALLLAAIFISILIRPKFIILEAGIVLWACALYFYLKKKLRSKYILLIFICGAAVWPILSHGLVFIKNALVDYHRGVAFTEGFRYRIYDDWLYKIGLRGSIVSGLDMLKAFFRGWAHFFLEPFPWKMCSVLSLASFPQMIIWYMMLPFGIAGIFIQMKRDKKMALAFLAFFLSIGTILAMTGGNIGTDLRIRDMLSPLIIVFSSIGLTHFFRVRRPGDK